MHIRPHLAAMATALLLVSTHTALATYDKAKEREQERMLNGKSLKGVNLGGWLVLEPWMSWYSSATNAVPSDVENTEYAISAYWRQQNQLNRIADHHNQFITPNTLDALVYPNRRADIVRIPLGHWATATGEEWPYVDDVIYYVDWIMNECEKRNLKVILDMHAAYGSQNGFFHSSPKKLKQADFCDEVSQEGQTYRQKTIDRLVEWTQRYDKYKSFWGIAVLNEPTCSGKLLQAWYAQAYTAIRAVSQTVWIIISPNVYGDDGRQDASTEPWKVWELQQWSNFAKQSQYVAVDLHLLQTPFAIGYDRWATMTVEDHMNEARDAGKRLQALCEAGIPLIVGEWSAAGPKFDWWKPDLAYQQVNDFRKLQEWTLPQSCVLAHLYWSARVDGNPVWSFL